LSPNPDILLPNSGLFVGIDDVASEQVKMALYASLDKMRKQRAEDVMTKRSQLQASAELKQVHEELASSHVKEEKLGEELEASKNREKTSEVVLPYSQALE